jgi:hypothetical protein
VSAPVVEVLFARIYFFPELIGSVETVTCGNDDERW